jgi:hypothetical protein
MFELMQARRILEPHGDGWKSRLRLSNLDEQLFWHSAFPTTDADSVFFGPDTYRYALAIHSFLDASTQNFRRIVDMVAVPGRARLYAHWRGPTRKCRQLISIPRRCA